MSEMLLINPRKRRRKSKRKSGGLARVARRASVGIRRRKRKAVRYRRNPIRVKGIAGLFTSSLVDGAIGAGGALAGQIVTSYLPLPDTLKTGVVGSLAKAGIGLAVGALLGNVIGKANGAKMAQGAVTVAMFELAKSTFGDKLPGLSAYDDLGAYDTLGEGLYGDPGLLGGASGEGLLGEMDDSLAGEQLYAFDSSNF